MSFYYAYTGNKKDIKKDQNDPQSEEVKNLQIILIPLTLIQ